MSCFPQSVTSGLLDFHDSKPAFSMNGVFSCDTLLRGLLWKWANWQGTKKKKTNARAVKWQTTLRNRGVANLTVRFLLTSSSSTAENTAALFCFSHIFNCYKFARARLGNSCSSGRKLRPTLLGATKTPPWAFTTTWPCSVTLACWQYGTHRKSNYWNVVCPHTTYHCLRRLSLQLGRWPSFLAELHILCAHGDA